MLRETGRMDVHLQGICKDRLLHYAGVLNELATGIGGPRDRRAENLEKGLVWGEVNTGNEAYDLYQRQQRLLKEKSREDKAIMSHSLRETAEIVRQLAQEVFALRPMEDRRSRQIIKMLKMEGLTVENPCYYPAGNGVEGILLTLHTDRNMGIRGEDVADMLSVLLSTSLQLSLQSPYLVDREKRSFLFVPQAPYIMLTGYAKVAKEGESISGDNLAIVEQERGRVRLLLSDGTGSGHTANESSGWVLDMMERLLETGYSVETGVEMVNSVLLYHNSAIMHPTLDICDIDLYHATGCFYKVGGSRSFLKRDQRIEEIHQENLPLGFFEKPEITRCEKKLLDGDYLIMVSDGVMEVLINGEYEDLFRETLAELMDQNPQVIAEKLLQLIIRLAKGHISDDMTILVAGIWEKSAMT